MSSAHRTLLDEIRDVAERDPDLTAAIGAVDQLVVRTPRAVIDDLHDLARTHRVSVNAFVHHLLDVGLEAIGRPTIRDRAPAIARYLSRTRKSRPAPLGIRMPPPRPDLAEVSTLYRPSRPRKKT
ncbi:hypothetical protein [Hansschlegelia beijingensis]|uniref:Uncharacterized protein n=1 Tax=Hansschlegelia beijingensis TaxID=1133344 RepID=A0A7W6D0H4_9HYPH|nr:hypothetical protein [Hansschlegelia beijingensis]MBB3971832.1 hypothetical protein [Hansschlegelia beijingensis]